VRVITVINAQNKTVTQYTRNGKILENFGHITRAIEANIEQFERSVILDGEMVSSSFQALMTQVHRKEHVQAEDARLMLFDILPLTEFQSGVSVLGQRRRSNLLRSLKPLFDKIGHIDIISQKEVDIGTFVGDLEFGEYNATAVADGYEGILVKDPEAKYECKRSHAWLKIKPFLTVDLTIVALEEGTGKNTGKLGALICEGSDQDRFIRVNVGSGLTDEQREEIWQDQDDVIGQIVEIKADCVTKNQDSDEVYSLRFPRFERFRGFKAGDKI
jgi:DNA ligase-1